MTDRKSGRLRSSEAREFIRVRLHRPVIFTIDDYEEYKASRGLAVYDGSDDVKRFFTGHLCSDKNEFFAALDDVNSGNDRYREKRHSL